MSAAPGADCWCRSRSPTVIREAHTTVSRRWSGRSLGQEHRHRRDQLRAATRQDPASWWPGEDERARAASSSCPVPEKRLLVPADLFHRRRAVHRIAQEEIFGPVLAMLRPSGPPPRRSKANNTPYGLSARDLDRQGLQDFPAGGRSHARGGGVGQHLQPVRPGGALRGLQGDRGFGREGGLAGLAGYCRRPDE